MLHKHILEPGLTDLHHSSRPLRDVLTVFWAWCISGSAPGYRSPDFPCQLDILPPYFWLLPVGCRSHGGCCHCWYPQTVCHLCAGMPRDEPRHRVVFRWSVRAPMPVARGAWSILFEVWLVPSFVLPKRSHSFTIPCPRKPSTATQHFDPK